MNTTTASTQFNPKYQVNAPKMTDSELREYYRENNIFISSNETGSVTNVLKNSSDVMAHLQAKFPSYTWNSSTEEEDIGYVSEVYYGNPENE